MGTVNRHGCADARKRADQHSEKIPTIALISLGIVLIFATVSSSSRGLQLVHAVRCVCDAEPDVTFDPCYVVTLYLAA